MIPKQTNTCPFEKLYPSQLIKDDLFFMKLAYNQAIDAWGRGEVPIGAVIAVEDTVIASAHNQVESSKDPTAHAEILAITQAAHSIGDWRLNQARLYVTKEPCPMCSGAAVMSRLKSVIYAFEDPKMGCLGGNYPLHKLKGLNHTLCTQKGVLEEPCKTLIQTFFELRRKQS